MHDPLELVPAELVEHQYCLALNVGNSHFSPNFVLFSFRYTNARLIPIFCVFFVDGCLIPIRKSV